MTEYDKAIFDLVNNPNYTFYKLYVDGKCDFDKFLDDINKNIADKKSFTAIINYMDSLSARLLSSKMYNHIHDNERADLYEFKKNDLRVYVIDQRPNIYIVMGGHKKEQKKDIAKFKNKTKNFPKQ